MQIQPDSQPQGPMTFRFLPQPNNALADKALSELLLKWGLKHSLQLNSYLFDLKFDPLNHAAFLVDLFNSPEVRLDMKYMAFKPAEFISEVLAETLTCKETRLDIFDKLEEDRIVVRGHIRGQFEEIYEEIQVADELRAALLLEDSEQYCTFSEADRQEFLFRLFKLLVLGGQMCQYEEQLQPYLDQTKSLYKSLVKYLLPSNASARKRADKDEIYLDTHAYQIKRIPPV